VCKSIASHAVIVTDEAVPAGHPRDRDEAVRRDPIRRPAKLSRHSEANSAARFFGVRSAMRRGEERSTSIRSRRSGMAPGLNRDLVKVSSSRITGQIRSGWASHDRLVR
jgi:hypothetical protein